MLKSMAERYPRPSWVRRVNVMGDSVGGADRLVSLDVDELVDLAKTSTGLSDFGDFDGDWRGRLDALVTSMEQHANLNVVGRLLERQEILRCLRTRLFMTRRLHEHPAILDEKIDAPVIVTGQGRSGTTILFELLSQDPTSRSISAVDAAHPVPPVNDPERLLAMTECEHELWTDVQPEFATIHEMGAHLPVECIHAMMPSFGAFQWWMFADVPDWAPDFVASMQFHKVFLQMMQFGKPEARWVLKTPVYLPILDLVFATYPDAWIVLTHRDPLKTIPSGLSTLASCRWHRSDTVDLDRIRAGGTGIFDLMVHILDRRKKGELPDRFVDLHFQEQMRDPVAAIEGAYARIGRPFAADYAARIRDYLAHKPKNKFGKHRYEPEDWGYTKAEIRASTQAYVEAYGVSLED
ncbi:MAG: sulfotransferase [Spirochaetaceae bacterium]|nr:sulfotransferase [Myxococcales bacterium]MCB9725307.1 sulfotransferase [Spirochaetaceae bacterium]HPG25320.1 sulfotransferase [Myxococcota bacterium]